MADFLIYNQAHWMDSMTEAEVTAKGPKFKDKFDSRYQIGEIIEAGHDGKWANNANPAFRVLSVPSISLEIAQQMCEPLYDDGDEENRKTLKRRRYKTITGEKDLIKIAAKIEKFDKKNATVEEVV